MFGFLKTKKQVEVSSPCNGKVVKIEDINDDVFSQKMMGDGIGIIPSDSCIYAPFDGEVAQVFDTKHALVLKDKNENQLLIHIGIDTVKLEGKPFKLNIAEGNKIKQGMKIAEVNYDLIKKNNLDTTVILVLLDEEGTKNITEKSSENSVTKDDVIFKIA